MKRTFKRVLAALLAVLMVVFSAPLTALAVNGPFVTDPWWDESNPPTSAVPFLSYNSAEFPGGSWEFDLAAPITLADYENLNDEYRPTIHVTLCDQGTAASRKYNQFYGYGTATAMTYDYDKVAANGTLLNPADLKAGQRVAMTIEMSGMDTLYLVQLMGEYNQDYLKAAYYPSNPKKNDSWAAVASTDDLAGCIFKGPNTYYAAAMTSANPHMRPEVQNIVYDRSGTIMYEAAADGYASGTSRYVGLDKMTVHGKDGIILGTFSFEVLQDCDFSEVFTWRTGKDSFLTPYPNGGVNDGPSYFNFDYIENWTVGRIAPVIYNNYSKSTTTETEFTFTPADGRTAVKVTAADSAAALASAPANSAAVTATNNNGTHTTTTYSGWTLGEDGVTFTETSSASTVDCTLNYTANGDATCEADGTKTATCPDCGYVSRVTDTGSVKGHDYSGTPVSNNDGTHTYTCANGCGVPKNEACSYTSVVTKEPNLTETGIRTFTCSKCGHSYTEDIPATGSSYTFVMADGSKTFVTAETAESALASAPAHSPAKVVDNKNGTHTTTTYDGWSLNAETKTYTETSSASTVDCTLNYTSNGDAACEKDGTKTATCPTCGYVSTVTDTGSALVHNMQLKTAEVPAGCETPGTTAVYECANGCGKTTGGTPIPATDHDMQLKAAEVPAGCETPGTTAVYECANGCGKTTGGAPIPATGHDMQKTADEIPATFDAPGKTAVYTCANGCGKTEGGDEIAQLVGVTVTVDATDMGETTLNGADATNGVATKVLKNSKITLTATAVGGAEFVGWAIGNKIVSEAATFTTTAIADVTYTPVFTTTEASTFTVVFVDSYGNVISTQDVATGTAIVEPEAPARIGYTFKEWSLTAAQIDDLTTGTTIVARYTKDAAKTFTVTAAGCQITVGADVYSGSATGIAYDTQVTVTASGATEWTINGAPVAYGESYTFYVGSDVTLVPTFEPTVTAKPTVAAVSVDPIAGTNKAAYLATYAMEAGCTEIYHGYVFGKDVNASDISLDKVNGTTIKAYYCKTTSKQFSLNISTSTPAVVTAKAFLAYVDNSTGQTVVIYAEPQSYTFS